jgi:16S rRNA C1402 N4-methylase RsmH
MIDPDGCAAEESHMPTDSGIHYAEHAFHALRIAVEPKA